MKSIKMSSVYYTKINKPEELFYLGRAIFVIKQPQQKPIDNL